MWLGELSVKWFYWFLLFICILEILQLPCSGREYPTNLVRDSAKLSFSSFILSSSSHHHHHQQHHYPNHPVFPGIHYAGLQWHLCNFLVFLKPINFMIIVHRIGCWDIGIEDRGYLVPGIAELNSRASASNYFNSSSSSSIK